MVQSGALGRLISFEFNETLDFNLGGYIFGNWRRHRAVAGPYLLEKCCHDLDLANWILSSRPSRVASFGGLDFFVPSEEKNIARVGENIEGLPAYQTLADPHRVNPFRGEADIVNNQVAILEYENGAHGTFHSNANAGIPERRFYFCGSEGSLLGDACSGIIEWKRIGYETPMERFETPCDLHACGDDIMASGLRRHPIA
ncbi:putative dehydrogenase [Puniceicoccus vermicola]